MPEKAFFIIEKIIKVHRSVIKVQDFISLAAKISREKHGKAGEDYKSPSKNYRSPRFRLVFLVSHSAENVLSFLRKRASRGFLMFDDDETDGFSGLQAGSQDGNLDDDLDDFDYYVSYIKALEKEDFSKSDIAREIMDEFDLEKDEAVRIVKRYFAEKENFSDEDEGEDDIVEDDDYSDGNSTEY